VHLQNVFVCLHLYIIFHARFLCVYVLIACSSKHLCGIAQLDAGYVTVCSAERTKAFSRVACLSVDGRGCYNMVSEIHFSTLSMDEPIKLSEEFFYTGFISKWPDFGLQSIHGKK
jgi:hypothetical protein